MESALETYGASAAALHDVMVDLIEHLSTSPAPAIGKNGALRLALSRSTPGLDRQQLASWLMASTPIRIVLKNADGGLTVRFDSKRAKARERDNLKVWDIPTLRATDWANAKKLNIEPPKAADVTKARAAFAKSVSKLAWEYEMGGMESSDAVAKAYAEIIGNADAWVDDAISEYRESDGWEEYAAKRAKARNDEKAATGTKSKSDETARTARAKVLADARLKAARDALAEATK
jgi:hypothetical protein